MKNFEPDPYSPFASPCFNSSASPSRLKFPPVNTTPRSHPCLPASFSTSALNSSLKRIAASPTTALGSTTTFIRSRTSRRVREMSSSETAYAPRRSLRSWRMDHGWAPTGVRRPSAMVREETAGTREWDSRPRRRSSAPWWAGSAANMEMPVPSHWPGGGSGMLVREAGGEGG
ncbi:hypothetical protein VUR80DRAFT_8179 [Thermomyces stellatus]